MFEALRLFFSGFVHLLRVARMAKMVSAGEVAIAAFRPRHSASWFARWTTKPSNASAIVEQVAHPAV
jgi:hypothetical protein